MKRSQWDRYAQQWPRLYPSLEAFYDDDITGRALSGEVDMGVQWTDPETRHPCWRVSWCVESRELYAIAATPGKPVRLYGSVESREQLDKIFAEWWEIPNFGGLGVIESRMRVAIERGEAQPPRPGDPELPEQMPSREQLGQEAPEPPLVDEMLDELPRRVDALRAERDAWRAHALADCAKLRQLWDRVNMLLDAALLVGDVQTAGQLAIVLSVWGEQERG